MMFEIPDWMDDHIIDALGGRERIAELMSGPRATLSDNVPLALLQREMEGKIALLARLRNDGCLH
jgi:hypothetical protein